MIRKWSFALLPLLIWALVASTALAQTTAFTALSPRQPLSSSPYAVRSLTAANALQLAGRLPSSFVQFDGSGNVGIGTIN
jgi:hypothetical protein